MKTVHKSVAIRFRPEEMFALVTGVEQYPQFLPWCDRARVIARTEQGMTAEIGMAMGPVRQSFVTANTHEPGRRVQMRLIKGPFSRLDGDWHFHPVGGAGATKCGCRVELRLHYGFSSGLLATLVGPVFDRIAASMVDAFVQRAEQVYGGR